MHENRRGDLKWQHRKQKYQKCEEEKKNQGAQDWSIQQETGRFQTEIIIFVLLAACIILFASNLGLGGFVGSAISNFGFGLFGLMAYIFPILFFMGSAFLLINKTNRLAYKKIAAVIVMFIFMCGAAQLLTDGYISSTTLGDYFALSADYKSGGGLIGGAICISITSAFGTVGGYVIIILAFVVCMIIITQRSLLDFVTMIVIKIIDLVKNGRARYQEGQPERRLRKEARAQQRQQLREERREERIRKLEAELAEDEKELLAGDDDFLLDPQEARKMKGGFLEGPSSPATERKKHRRKERKQRRNSEELKKKQQIHR